MSAEKLKQHILSANPEATFLRSPYDDALIGFMYQRKELPVSLYDLDECVCITKSRNRLVPDEVLRDLFVNGWWGGSGPAFAVLRARSSK